LRKEESLKAFEPLPAYRLEPIAYRFEIVYPSFSGRDFDSLEKERLGVPP